MRYVVRELEDAFVRWLCDMGIPPAEGERLCLDSQKHRYRVQGDKASRQNVEYCVYVDERPAGWIMDYKHGNEYVVWQFLKPGESQWTDEEKREYVKRKEAERAAAARQRELDRARASAEARRRWEAATAPRPEHPYLKRKGLGGTYGARQIGRDLVLPIRDSQGAVMNVQIIAPSGEKRFHPGAPVAGGVFMIGTDGGEAQPSEGATEHVFLCEGFATGATVWEATGSLVFVCLDCGNLPKAAEWLRERYPGRLVLAADNDRHTPGNPGMAAAFQLAEAYGIPFTAPKFEEEEKGSDWNDFAALHGIEHTAVALWSQLDEARKIPELKKHWEWPRWVHVKDSGAPMGTMENLQILLQHEGIGVVYDEVKKDIRYRLPESMRPGRYGPDNEQNAVYAQIVSLCEKWRFPTKDLDAYLVAVASENRKNPVLEWMQGKTWDGVDRLGALAGTLNLAAWFPEDLKATLIRRWMVSAAAACASKGEFKTRGVLVLQGQQAIGKTSWFAALVPPASGWFLDGVALDPEDKDSLKRVISHWIIELGELEATFKKADINKLKSYITSGVDVVRLPWARKFSEFPRRTVFCASVNQAEFLVDTTGNSRWWCLPCKGINYRHGIDMQQCWAQALDLYLTGERWWLDRDEEARLDALNRYFEAGDEIEDLIASNWRWDTYEEEAIGRGFGKWLNATAVLKGCGVANPSKMQVRRAGEVLRKLTGRDPERKGKARDRCFWMPDKVGEGFYR